MEGRDGQGAGGGGDRGDWFEEEGCPKLGWVGAECKQLQKKMR